MRLLTIFLTAVLVGAFVVPGAQAQDPEPPATECEAGEPGTWPDCEDELAPVFTELNAVLAALRENAAPALDILCGAGVAAACPELKVDVGAAQNVVGGDTVTLKATVTGGDSTYTYQWVKQSGPQVTLVDDKKATASFVAPDLDQDFTFKVTVTDGGGKTASKTATVHVTKAPVYGPLAADAGDDQIVDEREPFVLDGSASYTAPIIASYTWSQLSGDPVLSGIALGKTVSLTAPDVFADVTAVFELIIEDANGNQAHDTVSVQILDTTDTDGDGIRDSQDNCPFVSNNNQANADGDSLGDACDDSDGDGVIDKNDNCPSVKNPTQSNIDRDALGDACDSDADGDGVLDTLDNCLNLANDQSDIDRDNLGDACDADMDGDGFLNTKDLCPRVADDQADLDKDGIGDACDDDIDGDGVLNVNDLCDRLATLEHADLDGDRIGDACDDDLDGDGIRNAADLCPRHPDEGLDMDGDGIGDACDDDKDGDGRPDPVGGAPVDGFLSVDDAEVPGVGFLAVIAMLGAVLVLRRK